MTSARWKYNNSLLHYCSLVWASNGEIIMKRVVVSENRSIWKTRLLMKLSVTGLVWWHSPAGCILAARLFIIVAQNKSPSMALFLLPSSFLSLTLAKNGFKDMRSFDRAGETLFTAGSERHLDALFGCHIWTVASFFLLWRIKGGVCQHQLNISGDLRERT